jgi:hypothetical protein
MKKITELQEKYEAQMDMVLKTTEKFNKEHEAISIIKNSLKNTQSTHDLNLLLYEFWKFYRAFKLKEFILLFRHRIKSEIEYIDSTSNKTIDMIDRAFLWQITNWSNGSTKKYEQRFYSEMALNEFKINEVKYNKLSKTNRKILIKLIKISEPSAKNFDDNQVITEYIKCNPSITLLKFIGTSKIEEFKTIIHAFACQAGSKIQLDHVLNRITIKKDIEELCKDFQPTASDEIIEKINNKVDVMLPNMFGCVVHQDENNKLRKEDGVTEQHGPEEETQDDVPADAGDENDGFDVDGEGEENKDYKMGLWNAYQKKGITIYDFENEEIKKIEYEHIKINNPYDSIIIPGGDTYLWNTEKQNWSKQLPQSV